MIATEAPDRLLYRVAEVCSAIGVSRRTLEKMRAAGSFPGPDCVVGRSPRWRRSTLEAWVAAGGSSAPRRG